MEYGDGMLTHCNGHRCDGPSDAEHYVSDTSWMTGPQSPSTVQETAAVSGDRTKEGSGGDCAHRDRKLVLHFDVRNTILVSDSATHDNVEEALNSFLAGVTWGRKEPSGWVWYSDRPSLRAPCPGAVTYYKSCERELVRSPADRVRLRRITGDFTRQPIGRKFRKYFEAHLRLLEWNVTLLRDAINNEDEVTESLPASSVHDATRKTKPEVVSVDPKLTIVGASGRLYHYILPSFIKMLYDLQADRRRFAVILRTFGVDAPRVLDSIAHIAAGNHSLFPNQLPVGVDQRPGRIRRELGGRVRCELPPTADGVVLETDADIYRYMSAVDGVCGFVDDFEFWQENDYAHSDGKPLWIDFADPDVYHIFFDDNIRIADAEGIVDVRLFDGDCGTGGRAVARSLSLEEIALLEDVCLVQADLLEATSNMDYFIIKVRQCEVNYSNWLRRQQKSALHSHEPKLLGQTTSTVQGGCCH